MIFIFGFLCFAGNPDQKPVICPTCFGSKHPNKFSVYQRHQGESRICDTLKTHNYPEWLAKSDLEGFKIISKL